MTAGEPATIRTERDGATLTVIVAGDINPDDLDALADVIKTGIRTRPLTTIVFDLADVPLVDSSLLRLLLVTGVMNPGSQCGSANCSRKQSACSS